MRTKLIATGSEDSPRIVIWRKPQKLQELADSLTAHDLLSCGQKWLACLTPFFKESERQEAGCQHRLFFAQVEYCDNLIFRWRQWINSAKDCWLP